ncbi:MAG: HAD-IIA family hydrolase [Desulfovibrionaceae bacterium]|nr:HAD-IIA family hydrolase [Desulfovibrionaceae bacterium]
MKWSKKRCVVLDMDGTVYLGDQPIPGAVNFIQKHWTDLDFYFLTNNTSKSISTYVVKLNKMGIKARREILISPVLPLVNFLRKEALREVYLVGNKDFAKELQEFMPEIELNAQNPKAVILAYDTELTYEKLAKSALLLQHGVLFLATHPDLVCPSPKGPLPDVGSFLSLYETATGRRPQYIFGKPDPNILQPLLERYPTEEMVMVGDRLSTDKKLAEAAGIDFALVLSGEATLEDVSKEKIQPTQILENLGLAEKDW